MNRLYFGDNLTVLRDHVKDESVDLIYLDPPFNSRATYNVLFKATGGQKSEAQAEAFRDTWEWGPIAEAAYDDIRAFGGPVALVMSGLRKWLGDNAMMAYLAMMGIRMIELRRVLKPTGSLYLHCDPTASHYLKLVLDAAFGIESYTNEIIWKRYGAHNDAGQGSKHYGRVHDTIFFYSGSSDRTWHQQFVPLTDDYIKANYRMIDAKTGERFTTTPLTGPGGAEKGNPVFDWNGHTRAWRYSRATMQKLHDDDRLYYSGTGYARQKLLVSESRGVPVQSIWTDIPSLSGSMQERLGYPTQKPVALLERIISASSNKGDVVLDPFCGCGTTIDAAEKLGRNWVGIDVTHYAVTLIERRLKRHPNAQYTVHGRPTDLAGAVELAARDKHQFQWWAAWRLGAQRYREEKRGADRGVDGRAQFKNGPYGDGWIIISVKGGDNVSVPMVRDLRGVIEREEAEMGLLVTLAQPTRPMIAEAAAGGFVQRSAHGRLPRIQIVTIADILDGRLPMMPPLPIEPPITARPRKAKKPDSVQTEMLFQFEGRKQIVEKGEFIDPRFVQMG